MASFKSSIIDRVLEVNVDLHGEALYFCLPTIDLVSHFVAAFEKEDFETCAMIKAEVNSRILSGFITIDQIKSIRFTRKISGKTGCVIDMPETNGLFDKLLQ